MKILGIETSCDETAIAIVDDKKNILAHKINSQIKLHEQFGGVVPELAARAHIEVVDKLILATLKEANLQLRDIDGIAATAGPGLIGSVIVGLICGKTLASILQKPFIAVNHLEAHALTARLTNDVEFPYLLLLLSGGHCQILLAKGIGNYEKIGETIDDALGESFDKVAQMLGLPYPGGPSIEKLALAGDAKKYKFPQPLVESDFEKKHLCDFSFSGLKTAVKRQIEKLTNAEFSHFDSHKKLSEQQKADICASFQKTATDIILNRLSNALKLLESRRDEPFINSVVIAGGVAANRYIFSRITNFLENVEYNNDSHLLPDYSLKQLASVSEVGASEENQQLSEQTKNAKLKLITPPINLCTDNAAMIAWAGIEKLKLGMTDGLDFKPRAKWELHQN